MKQNQQTNPGKDFMSLSAAESIPDEFMFYLPPGTKFDDVYIDAQAVAEELNICKRVITNLKKAGVLSYTHLDKNSKVYYLRQEIAAILQANIVIGKKSILKTPGKEKS